MTMPSVESYGELIANLRAEAGDFDAAEDKRGELAACRRALRAVLQYLRRDPEVLNENLVRPLAVLASDAWDAGQGATVTRLEHTPEQIGPPAGTARDTVEGTMAFAVEMLVETRMGEQRALNWVAAEARRLRATDENGRAITTRQLKTWRSQVNRGKAPAEAKKVFGYCRDMQVGRNETLGDVLRQLRKERPHPPSVLVERAKKLAGLLILGVREAAPMSAPKERRANAG
jgi:hypothetical protein